MMYALSIGLFLGLCGCQKETDSLEYLLWEQQEPVFESGSEQETEKAQREEENQTLWVHICGYVQYPGIYEMPVDGRVYDALMAAGGFSEGANESALNLADYLKDGSRIYVPGLSLPETEDSAFSEEWESQEALININTASQNLLETLPGIGSAKAQKIIAYRKENGPFESIDELKEVTGIKEALFEKLKAFITVEG